MAEKADIWMPFYVGDYLADTGRLTTLQHGAYLLLMLDYWKAGPPPDDDAVLAQITRLTPDAWSIARAMLAPLFRVEDGVWRHKRIDAEKAKATEQKGKRTQKAKGAAEARWGKKTDATSMLGALPEDMLEQCPSPSPSPMVEDSPQPTAKQRGKRLPSDWQPVRPYPPAVQGMVDQWPEGREARELDGFRDYWTSRTRDAAKLDWDKTWHNRIRDLHDRIVREAGYANGRSGGGRAGASDGFTDAIRQSRASREARQRTADDNGGMPLLGGMGGDPARG